MKKALLILLMAVSSLTIMAQCMQSPIPPGLFPDNSQIPCINRSQPYNASLTFQNYDSTTVSGINVRVDYIIIDSILNLPCGVSWNTNFVNNRLDNRESGCIFLSGTTTDPEGQYKLSIKIRAKVSLLPNEVPYTLESITGLPIFIRVKESASTCPAIDTSTAATLQTSSCNLGFVNTYFNTVRGKIFVDVDGNGSFSGSDYGLAGYRVNAGTSSAYTNQDGNYILYLPVGSYNVAPAINSNYAISTGPSQYPFNFTSGGTDYPGNDFGFTVSNVVNDLGVTVNNSFFRPGFTGSYWVTVTNHGTVVANSNVTLNFDPLFTIMGSTPTASSQGQGTVTWAITNILPGQSKLYELSVYTPIDVNLLGDTVIAVATVETLSNNFDSENDVFTNSTIISGAYDPNDKTPYPDLLSEQFVAANSYITYRIRFQNTGNDTAFNITVRDTINSPHLNISTLSLLSASHEYTFRIEEGNIAIWEFPNILLPDSNVNEPGSHGYIFFRIRVISTNLKPGVEVLNQAGIYFDFNPVVMTEPSVASVARRVGITDLAGNKGQITLYPNPATASITIEHKSWSEGSTLHLMDLTGKLVLTKPLTAPSTKLNTTNLPNGVYLYRVADANGAISMGKVVVAH